MVAALRQLIQARAGISWAVDLPAATAALVTSFTDQLFKDGLVDKIIKLLDSISLKTELDRHKFLERSSGGGNMGGVLSADVARARHEQDIAEFVQEQRLGLAECLLYWTSQTPFGKDDIVKVLKSLQKVSVLMPGNDSRLVATEGRRVTIRVDGALGGGGGGGVEEEGEFGVMDPVSLCLFHTLLASFNIEDYNARKCRHLRECTLWQGLVTPYYIKQ